MLLAVCTVLWASDVDPRGPVLEAGKSPIVGRQSLQAGEAPQPISPTDRGPGVGKWIWGSDSSLSSVVRLRKVLHVEGKPKQVRAWITADTSYRLWINGRLASRGPADAGRDYDTKAPGPWFEDVRDLTRFLSSGDNLIAVEAFGQPLVSSEGTWGNPGFKMDLSVSGTGSIPATVGTDATWWASAAKDLDQTGAKNGFRLDMTQEPRSWLTGSLDNADWSVATVVGGKMPDTIVSELPPPMEAAIPPADFTRISPGVTPDSRTGGARFAGDGAYTVRYGYVLCGYVGLRIRGEAGARLLIMPNEHDAPGCSRQAEVLLRDGVQTLELPYKDSFSVINFKLEGATHPVDIEDVRCVFTSYPVQYRGEFSCSDPQFDRLWQVCRWVTQICMQTHHLDSPNHQEPISDSGDYLIESLNEFYAFGDPTLIRQDLKKIARTLVQRRYFGFHTSYTLLWVHMLLQYYDYTGDKETLKELSPVVFGVLSWYSSRFGTDMLLNQARNYMFMDWVDIGGFNAHHPPAVIGTGYMTCLYYQAFEDGLRIGQIIGDTSRLQYISLYPKYIRQALEKELWDPAKGLYRDGKPFQSKLRPNQWLPADKDVETFSTQVNTLAVSCGLVPKDRAVSVMKTVLAEKDMNCQPYFMHFVFEALDKTGLFDTYAAAQIARWKIVPDSQSFYEMWDSGDLSHAWNATLLYQMSGRILGVNPVEPGFAKFSIRPEPCGLSWAKGSVPTPHGLIRVSWNRDPQGLSVEFSVPAGTTAVVDGKEYGAGTHRVGVASL